jgi:hypothetical protein
MPGGLWVGLTLVSASADYSEPTPYIGSGTPGRPAAQAQGRSLGVVAREPPQ